jgi:hypothetical protein
MDKNAERKKNPGSTVITLSVLITAFLMVSFGCKPADKISAIKDESLRQGETRETLSPATFSEPFVAEMYQVAKDIPHVLDSLKCYCYCDRDPFNHVSLLSCYVDKHASG